MSMYEHKSDIPFRNSAGNLDNLRLHHENQKITPSEVWSILTITKSTLSKIKPTNLKSRRRKIKPTNLKSVYKIMTVFITKITHLKHHVGGSHISNYTYHKFTLSEAHKILCVLRI